MNLYIINQCVTIAFRVRFTPGLYLDSYHRYRPFNIENLGRNIWSFEHGFELEFRFKEWIFVEHRTSDIGNRSFQGGAQPLSLMKAAMETIKALKKTKRELKSAITRSLKDLAEQLAAKEPDCPRVTAILAYIEEKKEEGLPGGVHVPLFPRKNWSFSLVPQK